MTDVHENGTVQILHENWPYGSAAHLQTFTVRPGMVFVHVPAPVQATPEGPEEAMTMEPVEAMAEEPAPVE